MVERVAGLRHPVERVSYTALPATLMEQFFKRDITLLSSSVFFFFLEKVKLHRYKKLQDTRGMLQVLQITYKVNKIKKDNVTRQDHSSFHVQVESPLHY